MYQFESNEEELFADWLNELKKEGYVSSWAYEAESYILSDKIEVQWTKQLKTKTKTVSKVLQREISYTPDFEIYWRDKARGIFFFDSYDIYTKSALIFNTEGSNKSVIEIKADYDFRNMTRCTNTKINWMLEKHNINVVTVKIPSFFFKTFAPKTFFFTKTGRVRKTKKKYLTLKQWQTN